VKEQTTTTPQPTHHTNAQPPPGRGSKCILLRENQSMNNAKLLLPRILLLPLALETRVFIFSKKGPKITIIKADILLSYLKIGNFIVCLRTVSNYARRFDKGSILFNLSYLECILASIDK
jgi:hypothetical protein